MNVENYYCEYCGSLNNTKQCTQCGHVLDEESLEHTKIETIIMKDTFRVFWDVVKFQINDGYKIEGNVWVTRYDTNEEISVRPFEYFSTVSTTYYSVLVPECKALVVKIRAKLVKERF